MDIVGFVHINKNATTCKGAKNPAEFIGQTCPVFEFDQEGGVLCMNPQGTAMAMFDNVDVFRKFECSVHGDVICPPGQDTLANMGYATACLTRKGGYNKMLARMVIEASLMKGKFHDGFLWAKQG